MAQIKNNETLNSLKGNGIRCLYHITDRDNLSSIIDNAGLSSLSDMKEKQIDLPQYSAGDAVSRRKDGKTKLDESSSLKDYVHLYLNKPDESVLNDLKESGRLSEPFVLEVDPQAILTGYPIFSGEDASKGAPLYSSYKDLLDSSGQQIPPAAEIHFKNFIPYRFLTNIPKNYITKVSSQHPTAILFVLDHSESMTRSVDIGDKRYDYMSDALAETVNDQIRKLIEKCTDEDGAIHNRFDIAVIGYGKTAYSAWKAPFEGRGFVTVEELSNAMHESSSEVFPWIDPRDDGKSSKGDLALKMAYEMLKGWMDKQESRYYYPPIVIHITDGDVSNEVKRDFLIYAERIKSLNTYDGNVLLWNINITRFKQSELLLPAGDKLDALMHSSLALYEASSILPDQFADKIRNLTGEDDELPHRAMGINVTFDSMSKLLDIGTHAI